MVAQYDFFKTKYGDELLIDLILLEDLDKYIKFSPVQRLSYYDITIITEGKGTLTVETYESELKHGAVFFSSPTQIRKWEVSQTAKGFVLIFEDEFLSAFFNDHQFVKQLPYFNRRGNSPALELLNEDFLKLTGLLQEIRTEISSFKSTDKHILRALLYQTLTFLARKFVEAHPLLEKKPTNRYIEQFAQLVETNFKQERSVEYYAQELHITSGHLNSIVKEHYCVSAKKYILDKTIMEAKKMLNYTNMSIDQIADYLHYENTNYFTRTFREYTNTTPLNFRKQANP